MLSVGRGASKPIAVASACSQHSDLPAGRVPFRATSDSRRWTVQATLIKVSVTCETCRRIAVIVVAIRRHLGRGRPSEPMARPPAARAFLALRQLESGVVELLGQAVLEFHLRPVSGRRSASGGPPTTSAATTPDANDCTTRPSATSNSTTRSCSSPPTAACSWPSSAQNPAAAPLKRSTCSQAGLPRPIRLQLRATLCGKPRQRARPRPSFRDGPGDDRTQDRWPGLRGCPRA